MPKFLFLIKNSILLKSSLSFNSVRNIVFGPVSIRPPLFETIVAQPREATSTAVLPKGSSHSDGITEILVISYKSNVFS